MTPLSQAATPDALAVAAASEPPPVREKAPASAWYALAVLIATTLFAFVDRQIINLVAPSLQTDLGLSDLQLGIMHGVGLALFASAAAYPIGWLSDRFGRRLVLGCCILVWSISTAACAFQTSFGGLFVAVAGIAIGEAALSPVIFSMIPDLFPERQRNSANFIFFGVALLGVAVGLGLGGVTLQWLADNHDSLPAIFSDLSSWRVALILVAAPGPLFVLLLASIRMKTSSGRVNATHEGGNRAVVEELLPFLKSNWRVFAYLYAAIGGYTLATTGAFAWLPIGMPRIFEGIEASSIGMNLGIALGVGSIVGLALPPLGLRFLPGEADLKPLVLARMFIATASVPTLLMLFAWAPWQVYAAVGMQFTCMLATGALMPGLLQQLSPPAIRSRLISILGIVSAAAGGISPFAIGLLSGHLDPQRGVLIAIVVVSLPAWIVAAVLLSVARKPFVKTLAVVRTAAAVG